MTLRGTCMDMCPLRERQWREKHKLVHEFEAVSSSKQDKTGLKGDKKKMVKEFKRSAAGQRQPTASEIRPPKVLRLTVRYLIEEIVSRNDVSWTVVYDFVFDRLRAVRQDIFLQQAEKECVDLLEHAVRFYIYSSYRLCEHTKNFDLHINNVHLQECLKRLLVLYQENPDDDLVNKNRNQFEAFYLLHNLGSTEAIHHYFSLPKELRNDSIIKSAASLQRAYLERNFIRFFRLFKCLSALELCCVHQHLQLVRQQAIQIMNVAYSVRNCQFPITVFGNWLCLDDIKRMEEICLYYRIQVNELMVKFAKPSWSTEKSPLPPSSESIIDDKIGSVSLKSLFYN